MLVASAASRVGGHGGVEEEDWWWYQRRSQLVLWWVNPPALRERPWKLREEFTAQLFQIQVPTEATSCTPPRFQHADTPRQEERFQAN